MKLYSARRHEREISALSEEYGGRLKDLQAAEKAQRLLDDIRASYPDEAAGSRFKAFERRLNALLFPREKEPSESEEQPLEISSEEESEVHTELAFSKEPSLPADGEWDLKEVLETLGLSDD